MCIRDSISVPLWIYESNCVIGRLLKKPYPSLNINDEGKRSALYKNPDKNVKTRDIKTNEEGKVQLNITSVTYYPHNDTIIATYKCLHKGESSRSETKGMVHSRTCSFQNSNVSIIH